MKQWISIITTTFLLISSFSFADCPNAIHLKVGDTVKDCERIGLSLQEDLNIRKSLKGAGFNQQIIDSQSDLLKWKDAQLSAATQELDLYKSDSLAERQENDRLEKKGNTELVIGIAVGVLGSFLAARAWGWVGSR